MAVSFFSLSSEDSSDVAGRDQAGSTSGRWIPGGRGAFLPLADAVDWPTAGNIPSGRHSSCSWPGRGSRCGSRDGVAGVVAGFQAGVRAEEEAAFHAGVRGAAAAGCLIPSRVRDEPEFQPGLGSQTHSIPASWMTNSSRGAGRWWSVPSGGVRAADSAAEERESPPRPAKKSLYPWQGINCWRQLKWFCRWCVIRHGRHYQKLVWRTRRILSGVPGDCNALSE